MSIRKPPRLGLLVRICVGCAAGLLSAGCSGSASSTIDDLLHRQGIATPAEAACLLTELERSDLPRSVPDLAMEAMTDLDRVRLGTALRICLSPETWVEPVTNPPPPDTDSDLDVLWVSCATGNDPRRCDELFLKAPADTEYEQFGLTCGQRGYGDCVDVVGSADGE